MAQAVLNSLSSKGNQLRHVCIPQLVEDMLILWESIRPSNVVRNGPPSSAKMCGKSLNEEARTCLKAKSTEAFSETSRTDQNQSSLEVLGNHIKENNDVCGETKNLHIVCNETVDVETSVTCEGDRETQQNILRSSTPETTVEELEPLDLIHLNIKASIMCMASKIQSFMHAENRLSTSSESSHSQENIVNWTAELMPSMKKLRQAISRLEKTASLTYAVISMKECDTLLSFNQEVRHRRDIVFSQALTSLITGLMTRLWCQNPDAMFVHMLRTVGVLVHFEGLLSCYTDEMGALEDMIVGVDDLRRVLFWLEPCGSSSNPQPCIVGSRLFLSVVIPAPPSVIALLPKECSHGCHFTVCSVFFNIGINEQATIAEKFGFTSLQDKINQDSLNLLKEHFCRFQRAAKAVKNQGFRFAENYICDLLGQLQNQLNLKKSKNVEILHLAAEVCRHLGGIRFTSCKSAKDRTGMSVTLEQTMVLMKDFNLDEKEMLRALDCMRSEGTRRENTQKNVGVRKYAFTSLQLLTLPKLYRPPAGCYGNVQT